MASTEKSITIESLTGPQKCAVLCMTLGVKASAKILKQLSPGEIDQVSREMVKLPEINDSVVQAILQEFREISQMATRGRRGGKVYTQQVLDEALGTTESRAVLERIESVQAESGLHRLKTATTEMLTEMVRREHPQTIALIIAHLEQEQASRLLAKLDRDLAGDVLYRVASMDKVSPDVLNLVQSSLSGQAELSISQEATASGGFAAVAKLLNSVEGEAGSQLLEKIQGHDADMANKIKALMFVFEDLLLIDSKGVQRILREIDSKDLALALKAASEELKAHIRANMSERAGAALEEEIELLGPVRVKDVEAAHERIIEVVRQLDESGEILIRRQGGDDDFIE